jgi:hypothetical protein
MITFSFGNILRKDKIILTALRYSSLVNILNLLIVEVSYAISNIPKTIIQMQLPIFDLYLAESFLVHRGVSYTSRWYHYVSLMVVLMGLNSLAKIPSNFGMTF